MGCRGISYTSHRSYWSHENHFVFRNALQSLKDFSHILNKKPFCVK
jgi:hypothetical protein